MDVGNSMAQPLDSTGEPKLEIAKEATKLLLQQKLLLAKSHEVGIVMMGSEITDNDLAEECGGYEHIAVIKELEKADVNSMLMVNQIETTQHSADLLDAVVIGIDMISKRCGKKKYKKRMFILTDGNSTTMSDDQLNDIVDQINLNDIRVNVIAIGFGGEGTQPTHQQQKTEDILTQLVENVTGAIYPSHKAMQIYKQFRKRSVYPVAKYKGGLDLGLGYSLDVAVYGKTKEEPLPSLKKHSTAVEFSESAEEGRVQMSRAAVLEDDPTGAEVDPEEIVKAYYYGKSVVPVSSVEENLLKFLSKKCMKLLGYLKYHEVPREYFMGSVEMVLPGPAQQQEVAFAAIVHALYTRDDAILVRYCPRDNQKPRLGVLTPCIKPDLVCMWLNYLPTEEDVRDYNFADLTESTPQQRAVARDFINALGLDTEEEKLKPTSTFNPTLQYFYQCLTAKAENPQCELPPLDPNIEAYLRPDEELFAKAEQVCKEFASSFVLKEVEVPKKEKKSYAEVLEKKPEELPISEPFNEEISEITPVEDFYRLLRDRQVDRVDSAVSQMKELILKLVESSFRGNNYPKAIECLKNLRQGCLDEDEIDTWNQFMMKQVKALQQLHSEFWNQVVEENISLITSEESEKSTISQQEAQHFLVKTQTMPTQQVPEEDLLEDIE